MSFTIKNIILYPIKGISGIEVQSAFAEEMGFHHDRRMMLVDENGTFISQRTHPLLTQISCVIKDDAYEITVENTSIKVPKLGTQAMYELLSIAKSTVFDHEIMSYEVSQETSQWFSEYLMQNVKLVTFGEQSIRHKTFLKAPGISKVSFADGYPYMMLGTQSLNELSEKLGYHVPYQRFRPNIVVHTLNPFEEDNFESIKLDEARFKMVKPCARCQVVNIDPKTGNSDKATLQMLSTYRKADNKVYFGANLICENPGMVRVGERLVNG